MSRKPVATSSIAAAETSGCASPRDRTSAAAVTASPGKLVPALASHSLARQTELAQEIERERMHGSLGEAAGAVTPEAAAAPMIDQRLGEDAPRRVAGAEKEHV